MSIKKNASECLVDGCPNMEANRSYCYKHYKRLQIHGDPLKLLQTDCKGKICGESGCGRPARKRLLCNSHYTLLWRKEKPELARKNMSHSWHSRMARHKNAIGSHTRKEWEQLLDEYDGLCAYCGERKATERDHVVSLAAGGSHYISNILPACATCNRRKWIKPVEVFMAEQTK